MVIARLKSFIFKESLAKDDDDIFYNDPDNPQGSPIIKKGK